VQPDPLALLASKLKVAAPLTVIAELVLPRLSWPVLVHELASDTEVPSAGAGVNWTFTESVVTGLLLPPYAVPLMTAPTTASFGGVTKLMQPTEIVVDVLEGVVRVNLEPPRLEPVQGCPIQGPSVAEPQVVVSVRLTVNVKVTDCPVPAGRLMLRTFTRFPEPAETIEAVPRVEVGVVGFVVAMISRPAGASRVSELKDELFLFVNVAVTVAGDNAGGVTAILSVNFLPPSSSSALAGSANAASINTNRKPTVLRRLFMYHPPFFFRLDQIR
jgi:hypothetical protein